jgi:antitoxin component YwqK of YwqJK toxin-antitoxin module
MRTLIITLAALIVLGFAPSINEKLLDTTWPIDGKYISYWANGKKKAEGEIRMNMRSGEWNLWDSTGTLLMTRFYSDGFTWKQTFPADKKALSSAAWIDTVRGKDYFFRKIKPDSVIHSFRMWTYAPYDRENPLFKSNAVLDTIIAMRMRGEIIVGDDDQLMMLLSMGEFFGRLESSENRQLLGFRIKEDWYYDYRKQSGIFSIVAICPVLKAPLGDSLELGWIPYDDVLRAKLAAMSFLSAAYSEYPIIYDEMFLQRSYVANVYKYTNVRNKTIADIFPYEDDQRKEALRIQRAPFEWEHDHWADYYSKKQKAGK